MGNKKWVLIALLLAGCHEHDWKVVAMTHADPVANVHISCTPCSEWDVKVQQQLAAGSTTVLLKCSCGETREVTIPGAPLKKLPGDIYCAPCSAKGVDVHGDWDVIGSSRTWVEVDEKAD